MHAAAFGKALRSLALVAFFSLTLSPASAFAQARHEYVAPNPQRYQHAPVPEQTLPNFATEPDGQHQDPDAAPDQTAQNAQPLQPQRQIAQASLDPGANQILAFVHEHMVALFILMLLLAPFGAMLAMRKTEHPYDH